VADQDSDKTQDATPHRRQEAREKGEVARSHDLASALVMLAGLGLLFAWWTSFVEFFGGYAARQLGGSAWLVGDEGMVAGELRDLLGHLATVVLPFLAMLVVIGIAANLLQFGFLLVPDKLMPDLSRIDPLAGFSRVFSMQALVKLVFGLIKIAIVGSIAWYDLSGKFEEVLGLAALSLPHTAAYLTTTLFWTTFKIAAALAIIALLDFGFQWWKNEQDMKMTTQEIREEMKNMQGDPQVAARRRQVQRELVKARLKSTVPNADVVVTNPTELAIALKYDPEEMAAPVVLAKGAGALAQRIRQLALEHGIPIIEKKPLAQALYKDVDVGRPIPGALYSAVAEIMAYVYQLKGKKMPAGRA
jgi:flagellar biosynthesis protein FlhB